MVDEVQPFLFVAWMFAAMKILCSIQMFASMEVMEILCSTHSLARQVFRELFGNIEQNGR